MPRVGMILAVALGIRLVYVLAVPQVPAGAGDDRMYDEVAVNLVEGRGFVGGFAGHMEPGGQGPEIGIGPVYPSVLAAIYRIAGHRHAAVRVVQAVMSVATIALLLPVVTFAFGAMVARLAGWLMAGFPPFIIYTGMLLTETVFMFMLAMMVFSCWQAMTRGGWWRFVATGVIAGLTILLRAEMLVALPAMGVLLWRAMRGRMQPVGHAWLCVLAIVITVGTWTARNYRVFQKPILVSAHGGDALWISAKGWTEWRYDDPEFQQLIAGKDYVERSEALYRAGIQLIREDPWGYFRTCVARIPQFWVSSHTSYLYGYSAPYLDYWQQGRYGAFMVKLLLLVTNLLLIGTGIYGIVYAIREHPETRHAWLLLLIPAATIALVHFMLFAAPRYQVPLMLCWLAFAARGITGVKIAWPKQMAVPAHP